MKGKILTMALAGSLLYLCSCSDASKYDALVQPQPGEEQEQLSDEVEVTFQIETESSHAISRAPGDEQTISKGKKIDMLVYGIYELGNDGKYNILRQYNQGIAEELQNTPAVKVGNGTHTGQTVAYVGDVFGEDGSGIYTITLRLMRNKEYYMAYWAQCSETDAYDTNDLENVTVSYNGLNNDETRDAFCKVDHFSVRAGENRTVILTRPFAQINVGTTGADYKYYVNSDGGVAYTLSSITIKGVSTSINVVTDQIAKQSNEEITFGPAILPAYINFSSSQIPTEEEELIGFNPNGDPKEELLYVDLNVDGSYEIFLDSYPTIDNNGNFLTESFKYFSMCYVLVPATEIEIPDYDGTTAWEPEYSSTVLQSVSVSFTNESKSKNRGFSLINVPVHRNWRTNILGGLYAKNPTPEESDPTSLFKPLEMGIYLAPGYDNETNNDGTNNGWKQQPATQRN